MSTTAKQGPAAREAAAQATPAAAVAALQGAAGNRAVQQLVAAGGRPPVQRDLVGDTRRSLRTPLTQASAQLILVMMYTSDEATLVRACRLVTAAQWLEIIRLVPDGLSPAEGSARIIWARTRNASVFDMLAQIPESNVQSFMRWLGEANRRRLAAAVTHAMVTTDQRRRAVRAMFDATPDGEFRTLVAVFTARFRVRPTGGGDSPRPFTAPAVRRLYNLFQALPEGAVADNPSFGSLGRERGRDGSGYYVDSSGAVVISYTRLTERWDRTDATAGRVSSGRGMGVNNALTGQNVFDSVVRHEVGHAVDNRLNLNATYCVGTGNARGGAWVRQATATMANDIVTASGGFINGLPAARRTAVVSAVQWCVTNRQPDRIRARVTAALAIVPLAQRPAAITAAMADPAVAALQIAFSDKTPGNPWYRSQDDGGSPVGARIFQEAYPGEWWSYASAARARKVSQYQFRSPYEWIAEAYNAYYAPPTRGSVLRSRDAATTTWFDTSVHTATAGISGAREQAPPAAGSGPGFS